MSITPQATKADAVVMLSEEESGRFLAALDAPFQPNEPLRQAMQNAAALVPRLHPNLGKCFCVVSTTVKTENR